MIKPHMIVASTLLFVCVAGCTTSETVPTTLTRTPKPRGDVRIVYVSDLGSDMKSVLTENPTAAQLRAYVDTLAANGVDIYAQDVFSKQGVGWFEPEHPDHEPHTGKTPVTGIPPQDGPPIAIVVDQSHRSGMKFLAAFRMADRHGGSGTGMLKKRQDLWNPDFPARAAMDYTHDEIRDWVYAIYDEILRRFDVDGFEFTYTRWMHCFPVKAARDSHPIMTKFLRRVRARLDEASKQKGRRLMLGVRVPQTLEECDALGYDVATWAREGLVDYLAPCDFFFTDFNAQYDEFAAVTRGTDCMLYPAVHPLVAGGSPWIMQPDHYRAAARNMYAAGADGISQFNFQYHWVRRRSSGGGWPWIAGDFPKSLAWLRQIRGDGRYDGLPRHYLFMPLQARSESGFVKFDKIRMARKIGSGGEYRFRIAEDLTDSGTAAELVVSAVSWDHDQLSFSLNGTPLPDGPIRSRRHGKGRAKEVGRPMKPYRAYMIPLTSPPAVFGDNVLRAEVTALDKNAPGEDDIIVEELEVTVVPPWKR